ncbi:hypothetical protein SPKIRA_08140 [Sphingomonas paucimobilis]|uniref:carph-isopro domain-containing protein n=1 Tax=Sphingomonas TaxID=13687 RepID=UPI0015DD2497|nr:hypothetical protein SPKIRA_08140 [Sphingomonas paucimobilis]
MPNVASIIETLGGVRKTAAAMGVPPTTVQHWKSHDRVPAWREAELTAAYKRATNGKVAA